MRAQETACPAHAISQAKDLLGKLETALEHFREEKTAVDQKQLLAEARFEEEIRRLVLGENSLDDIVKVAFVARPDIKDELCEAFGKAISKLAARGYIKIGEEYKVGTIIPPELISEKLQSLSPGVAVHVVNGGHPIFKSIDMLEDVWEMKRKNLKGESITKDRMAASVAGLSAPRRSSVEELKNRSFLCCLWFW